MVPVTMLACPAVPQVCPQVARGCCLEWDMERKAGPLGSWGCLPSQQPRACRPFLAQPHPPSQWIALCLGVDPSYSLLEHLREDSEQEREGETNRSELSCHHHCGTRGQKNKPECPWLWVCVPLIGHRDSDLACQILKARYLGFLKLVLFWGHTQKCSGFTLGSLHWGSFMLSGLEPRWAMCNLSLCIISLAPRSVSYK